MLCKLSALIASDELLCFLICNRKCLTYKNNFTRAAKILKYAIEYECKLSLTFLRAFYAISLRNDTAAIWDLKLSLSLLQTPRTQQKLAFETTLKINHKINKKWNFCRQQQFARLFAMPHRRIIKVSVEWKNVLQMKMFLQWAKEKIVLCLFI